MIIKRKVGWIGNRESYTKDDTVERGGGIKMFEASAAYEVSLSIMDIIASKIQEY